MYKKHIEHILPEDVNYLNKYDEFKNFIDDVFEMPDDMVALLLRFLEQNNETLSSRAKNKEFQVLTPQEVIEIERGYSLIFRN